MENVYLNKDSCCGCSACMSICPTKSITMKADDKGFLYPQVNHDTCIKCGVCRNVCDFRKFEPTNLSPKAYAIKHRDENEVKTSRSGAVFMAMCNWILSKDGYVFGCELEDKKTIVHKVYNTKLGIKKFKGSKYVQSNPLDTFRECAELLMNGNWVLYSGTGCQVHGLLSFLEFKRIDTAKLVSCDLVCHGAPSPKVWELYIDEFERRNNKVVNQVDFRDKNKKGWKAHFETLKFTDATSITTKKWTNNFYAHTLFRESCYNCKYTTPNRKTDFTIADCWGIEKVAPEFDDNKGVSLLLVRTCKANDIFEEIKELLRYKEIPLDCVMQPQLRHPAEKGAEYDKFWLLYGEQPDLAIRKYFFPNPIKEFVTKVYKKASKILKK